MTYRQSMERPGERTPGALTMRFFIETAAAAHPHADPFDQPAVELGKQLTRQYLAG
ncbi:MAG: hypothetical protein ACLPIX_01765 [Rhodomicrobium sp.]